MKPTLTSDNVYTLEGGPFAGPRSLWRAPHRLVIYRQGAGSKFEGHVYERGDDDVYRYVGTEEAR